MRTIHTEQSSKDFYTARAGLKLLGKAIAVSGLQRRLRRLDKLDGSSGRGIRHAEIVMTYLGLIAQGKSDFESAENVRQDWFFRAALGIEKSPSSARLRQRMDESSMDYARALDVAVIDFLVRIAAPVGALWTGHVPLDMDLFPQDNSGTKKEHVGRTYRGFDGYGVMSAYLGT